MSRTSFREGPYQVNRNFPKSDDQNFKRGRRQKYREMVAKFSRLDLALYEGEPIKRLRGLLSHRDVSVLNDTGFSNAPQEFVDASLWRCIAFCILTSTERITVLSVVESFVNHFDVCRNLNLLCKLAIATNAWIEWKKKSPQLRPNGFWHGNWKIPGNCDIGCLHL